MWGKFTENSRRAIFFAQEEAARYGESSVSTEHLLLGLLREPESIAGKMLRWLGIDPEELRHRVERQVPKGDGSPGQDMQLRRCTKRAIDLSYEQAQQFGDDYIGTEHLLLGIVAEGESMAAGMLMHAGANLKALRQSIEQFRPHSTPAPPADEPTEPRTRLNGEGQRVLFAAREEAAYIGEKFVGTEHLLLGLLREENNAVRLLKRLGIDPGDIRRNVEAEMLMERGNSEQEKQLTPRAQRVLDLAGAEAMRMGARFTGAEHLLLGLVSEGNVPVARLLIRRGLNLEKARRAVLNLPDRGKQQ